MDSMQKRIEAAVESAQEVFWLKVAECFPEAQSGDFPPGAQLQLDAALKVAVSDWVASNVPRQDT